MNNSDIENNEQQLDSNQVNDQAIDPSYYDQYYGGTNMQYNYDQISQYEQGYDESYAQQYQDYYNYYNQYYANQQGAYDDASQHKQLYQYFLENYEYMKQNFPKKRKILRWEEIDKNYNSMEDNQFIDLLDQMQESEKLHEAMKDGEDASEYADVIRSY